MFGRRVVAGVAVVLFVAGVVVAVVEIVLEFPRGLVVVALLAGTRFGVGDTSGTFFSSQWRCCSSQQSSS